MKRTKQLTALLFAVCLILMLCACGTTSGESSTGSNAQTSSETSSTAEAEPKVYTLMASQGGTEGDWNDMWLFKKVQKELNIKIDMTMVSDSSFEEKKNLAFATDTLPDFFLAGSLNEQDISSYGGQGLLFALEDYINEKYTPNIVAAFNKYKGFKASLTYPDGHIYNITGLNTSAVGGSKYRAWINTAWAKELNVPVPTTLDEYYNYLVAIKNGDPNKNGKNDEIPFSGIFGINSYYNNTTPILTAFGFAESRVEAKDGKAIYVPAQPTYKEYLTYMNKIYKEGLIDSEYFTQTEDQFAAKIVQGQIASYTDYAHWLRNSDEKYWGQYNAVEPMTSKYNSEKIWPAYDVSPLGAFVITKECDDPQDLIRFANWCYDMDNSNDCIQGVPVGEWTDDLTIGYQFNLDKDGHNILTKKWPDSYETYSEFSCAVITPRYGIFPTIPYVDFYQPGTEAALNDEVCEHQAPYYQTRWSSNIRYTSDESDEISLLQTDIYSYTEQMEAKFITGEISLDEFDSFVKGCYDRGLERLLKIQQSAYDRWASTNQ